MTAATPADAGLRETFDRVASDYDAVRPGYPDALLQDIVRMTGLSPADAVLEVGCGTGQATVPFARRGHPMVCLDIGANMLAVASRNCRDYPGVQFVCEAFESWNARDRTFALVLSATAFHWVPAEVRYARAASALANGGHLAIVVNYHPRPYTEFFTRVQTVYKRVVPEWGDPGDRASAEERIAEHVDQIDRIGLFDAVAVRQYPWSRAYTAVDYVRLLNTYSGHIALPCATRRELFAGVTDIIDGEFGGSIVRPYLSVLFLARIRE
ncbi:class I SAM-dependent methyltransferase [Candidatus Poribacteria bacterium]|nr:class I SAM-dependent methyltransferase [Candidatus Poribacteria bacterium]MBT5532271.1 class I SAM-dependent methyltransferase [Candidatus Poribacteria bacterium]MBT5709526.1 class I SAM-dependent methyltransferase [Candidatus Poribacteria bacterium]MBT7100247.1 class I SAM-dependent methyltransferase [Candidatus Poribacteria bacterium]MBT7803923.1 class I SAM-dependent methyltransferase [Candidatus Poribacteria bacterium]